MADETRSLALLREAITRLEKRNAGPKPLIGYAADANDAEAVEVSAEARAGDADALVRVHALIRERKWVNWLGDLGKEATHQLVHKASGGDPVWKAGITQKANALHDELLGERPTVLERLLARRVVKGWLRFGRRGPTTAPRARPARLHQGLHQLGATRSNSVHLVSPRDRRTNRRRTRARVAETLEMSTKNPGDNSGHRGVIESG